MPGGRARTEYGAMTNPEWMWMPPDSAVEGAATLRDGARVWIREVRNSDPPLLQAFLAEVSEEALEYRFFAPVRAERALEEILRSRTGEDQLSLVAASGPEAEAAIWAHAEFAVVGPDPFTAEVAFLVRDSHRGRGLATLLLYRLAAAARRRGLSRFCAYVLPGNDGMLEVLHNSGFPATESLIGGVIWVYLSISEPPSPVGRLPITRGGVGRDLDPSLRETRGTEVAATPVPAPRPKRGSEPAEEIDPASAAAEPGVSPSCA